MSTHAERAKREEDLVLERLANRKGYSYLNNESPPSNSPATMKAYYASQHLLRIEEQKRESYKQTERIPPEKRIMHPPKIRVEPPTIHIEPPPRPQMIQPISQITHERTKISIAEQMEKEKKRELWKPTVPPPTSNSDTTRIPPERKIVHPPNIRVDPSMTRRTHPSRPTMIEPIPQIIHERTKISITERMEREKTRESWKPIVQPSTSNSGTDHISPERRIVHPPNIPSMIHLSRPITMPQIIHERIEKETIQRNVLNPITKPINHLVELELFQKKSDLASKQLDRVLQKAKNHTDAPIHIFLLCFNERTILPHTVAHYKRKFPSCHITIYDNESSDDSVSIATQLGCHVVSWTSYQINDESLKIKIRNQCWKHIKTGWIIVADMDEWIDIDEEELKKEEEKGTTILSIEGLEMMGESHTLDFSDIQLDQITRYVPFSDESKNLCFLRSAIDTMNFGSGSHTCNPKGMVQFSQKIYQLRHMCNLGLPFLLHKMKQRYERSALNRSKGWSIHYSNDEEKIREKYMKLLSDSISL